MRILKFILLKVVEVGAVVAVILGLRYIPLTFWNWSSFVLACASLYTMSIILFYGIISIVVSWLKSNWKLAGKKWRK